MSIGITGTTLLPKPSNKSRVIQISMIGKTLEFDTTTFRNRTTISPSNTPYSVPLARTIRILRNSTLAEAKCRTTSYVVRIAHTILLPFVASTSSITDMKFTTMDDSGIKGTITQSSNPFLSLASKSFIPPSTEGMARS